jgi:hypothetical protein
MDPLSGRELRSLEINARARTASRTASVYLVTYIRRMYTPIVYI